MGDFLRFRPVVNTGWEESTTVDVVPWVIHVAYMGNYDGVRGRE